MSETVPVIPGWKILRMLGQGGFGKVYEIEKDDEFGGVAHSALKVISIPGPDESLEDYRREGYTDEALAALFRSRIEEITEEFRLMSHLKGCSNIVSYEDHAIVRHTDDPGCDVYIRMELLTPLPVWLDRRFGNMLVDEQTVRKLGIDICGALERCSRHNIIHRDLKPQNIFVNEDGDFKLGDFGVAKTGERFTHSVKVGTYSYMAPEIYHGQPYTTQVDLYSLGMVLYWLLNERRGPFAPMPPAAAGTDRMEQAMERRMRGELLPPPKYGSPNMKRIVLKACSFDPGRRYPDATAMKNDLRQLVPEDASALFRAMRQAKDPSAGNAAGIHADRPADESKSMRSSGFTKPEGFGNEEKREPTVTRPARPDPSKNGE